MGQGQSKKTALIVKCFKLLSKYVSYWDVWRPSNYWVDNLKATFPLLIQFDMKKMI